MELSRDSVERTLRETWEAIRTRLEAGTMAVRDSVGRLPLLASVLAAHQRDDVPRDESHYFLIPTPFVAGGYVLYTMRRLPPGASPVDDLPRLRVLHLPGAGHEDRLLELFVAANRESAAPDDGAAEPASPNEALPDRLQRIADEIERHERNVTGGILLIGGVVAVANPLLGVGIAAKAAIPSLGALLSREGLKLVGDKVRAWNEQRKAKADARERAAADRAAEKKFRSAPATSVINPVLRDLEHALRTDGSEFEPSVAVDFGEIDVDGWNREELVQLTVQAITETYGDADGDSVAEGFHFGPEDRRWYESLQIIASRALPGA